MQQDDFRSIVMALPVYDTHTHMDVSPKLNAQTFWDIAHYFWYCRELEAAGYPGESGNLTEDARAKAFLEAFHRNRNTYWNHAVGRACRDLFDVTIEDAESIRRIQDRIAETRGSVDWTRDVLRRAGLQRICVGSVTDNELYRLEDTFRVVPSMNVLGSLDPTALASARDQRKLVEQRTREMREEVKGYADRGLHVVRAEMPFVPEKPWLKPELKPSGNTMAAIKTHLGHVLLEALEKYRCHVQIFFGMDRHIEGYTHRNKKVVESYARNDPRYVCLLHPIFDFYSGCTFELISAAENSALDIVQAARIYPNVYPGGLWWFNFRASTYQANMQYRIEALSGLRSTLVASDAQCAEWCCIKVTLVKEWLAEFLWDQVACGREDVDSALFTARSWLYDTAAALYEER